MPSPSVQLSPPRLVSYPVYRDHILALRKQVWEAYDPAVARVIFDTGYEDKFDEAASHWVIEYDGNVIAACRLSVHHNLSDLPEGECYPPLDNYKIPVPVGSLNRLVVLESCRGQSISHVLDEIRLKQAVKLGCRTVLAASAIRRQNSLTKLGFRPVCPLPLLAQGYALSAYYS